LEVVKMNKNSKHSNRKHIGILGRITCSMLMAFALAGCAHVISKEILMEVDKGISYEKLSNNPGEYKGKTVLLGGIIVKTENKKDGTLLEIYETALDSYGEPINTDLSKGRFLAMDKGFLDSEIYRAGRKVTIGGVMNGVEVMKLGEIDYSYPYLVIKDIHLWEEDPSFKYDPYYQNLWDPLWGVPWHSWRYYPYWPYTRYYYNNTYRYYSNQENPKRQDNDKGRVMQKALEKTQNNNSQENSVKIQNNKGSVIEKIQEKKQND